MTAPVTRRPADLAELPLSALQQRIWYLCTAYSGDASPQVFVIWRLRGPLKTQGWCDAVGAVVDRHESFRTTFVLRDGQPVQVIKPPGGGLETELIDLTGLPEPEREEQAQQIVAKRTHALLDLVGGPLVRSCLIRLGEEHHVWCFTEHHVLADGASQRILAQDMRAAYQSFVDDVPLDLPELKVQYGDFALWQQTVQQPSEEADLDYWREQLADVPLLDLPTDRPRPAEKVAGSGELFHSAGGELPQRIAELARARRCTPFMVLLAAMQALLASETGQEDICVGSAVAGRTVVDLEPVVGLFANTVALRGDLSGDPTFAELLLRTRKAVIAALRRQNVPFSRVVDALNLPRIANRTQLFQVIFSMRPNSGGKDKEDLAGLQVEDFPHPHAKTLHDLVIDVWRLDEHELSVGFRYDDTLFDANRVAALAQRYEQLLTAVVDRPEAHLSELTSQTHPAG
ncbi:hypothetical protein Rhe02_91060 [Rhizocola hellebori]|uniref:Condensation domain-containing protein n=1 Tax=Rhizocola hellebori TaxID=1392758 RepID=A0A8J3QH60_9ACTN|nr:condensation domain-containing protein [Rhizocola hellebori]GIH11039.1 hypothetical protein Rhe02_91060 [Rhizocola hellebori]